MEFVYLKIDLMEAVFTKNIDLIKSLMIDKEPYIDPETLAMLLMSSIQKKDVEILNVVIDSCAFKNMYQDIEDEELQIRMGILFNECFDFILKYYSEHLNSKDRECIIKDLIVQAGKKYICICSDDEIQDDDKESIS